MRRTIFAFLGAPFLVSLVFFGPLVVVAYPLFLIVTFLIGAPLFLLCRRLGWLSWWHAAFVGAICSVAGICVDLNSAVRAELYGPSEAITFAAMGCAVGLLFWFLAIFRSAQFPSVDRRLPASLLLLVPLMFSAWLAHERMETFDIRGRLASSDAEPAKETGGRQTARMAIPPGAIISAALLDGQRLPALGSCAFIVGRRSSVFSDARRYWVLAFEDDASCRDEKTQS